MKGKMLKQLLLLSMFAEASNPNNIGKDWPIRRNKPPTLKICPICGTEHQESNRFCSEECKLISKERKKQRKLKRKKQRRKR